MTRAADVRRGTSLRGRRGGLYRTTRNWTSRAGRLGHCRRVRRRGRRPSTSSTSSRSTTPHHHHITASTPTHHHHRQPSDTSRSRQPGTARCDQPPNPSSATARFDSPKPFFYRFCYERDVRLSVCNVGGITSCNRRWKMG